MPFRFHHPRLALADCVGVRLFKAATGSQSISLARRG